MKRYYKVSILKNGLWFVVKCSLSKKKAEEYAEKLERNGNFTRVSPHNARMK